MRARPLPGLFPEKRPAARRYSMAMLFVAVGAAAVAACIWWFSLPAFLILVAVIAAAQAYGGIGPGLVAASVALGLSVFAFLPPHLAWHTEQSPWPLAGFFYGAAIVSYLLSCRARWNFRRCQH